MPIYEYCCEACDHKFERLTTYAERERVQVCPACESTRTRVLVSSFAALGGEFESTLPMAPTGGGCCGGSCGCSPN